ncbi:chitin-binding protein [Streptomyces sp. NPDC048434]|uniref:chitin-binding protein n=1 Tax=Streptomyces sp. NPDC048434 TaxID=3365549 RepID=UPI0037182AF8
MIALLGALAFTAASAAFGPTDAEAVNGVITYHIRQGNRMYRIEDPGDDHCYGVGDGYGEVDNATPTDLVLYNGRDCTGSVVVTVHADSWLNARFGSLRLSANGPRYPEEPENRDSTTSSDNQEDRDSPARSDRPEDSDRPTSSEGRENSDRPRDTAGPDHSANQDRPAKPDRPANQDRPAKPDRPANQDRPAKPDRPADPVNAADPMVHPGSPGRPVRPVSLARPVSLMDPASLMRPGFVD